MDSTNHLKELLVEIPKSSSEFLSLYLEEAFLESCLGYYEVMYDEENQNDTKQFIFYFPSDYTNAEWDIETILLSLNIDDYYIESTIVEEKNYWEEYRNSFQPFFVTKRFFLVPVWENHESISYHPYLPIFIQPGSAFGTGLHPSTQLALEWIEENDIENQICLDAGCGSGILSIALLRKKVKQVIAFDIDPMAIEASKKNLNFNFLGTEQNIHLYLGSWDLPELMITSFDIIIANLSLPVFAKYINYIEHIQTYKFVISGISVEQEEDCNQIFNGLFQKSQKKTKEGWLLIEYHSRKN